MCADQVNIKVEALFKIDFLELFAMLQCSPLIKNIPVVVQ